MHGQGKSISGAVAAVIAVVVTLGVAGGQAAAIRSARAEATGAPAATSDARPHVLHGPAADVIVRLRGALCSGTPITGTHYVVTAAHCVLSATGEIATRTVERDGVVYTSVAVLVDTEYVEHPSSALDAAVLVMDDVVAGPSARLGSALPDSGSVTLAGLQPLDTDGSLLRGHDPYDRPRPTGATGTAHVESRTAGCEQPAEALTVESSRVLVQCGLIPGASGGGLFAEDDGELVLVGIVSTVTSDLTANGVVPLASLHELLQHPDRYTHLPDEHTTRDHSRLQIT